jgi:hypothetical protein
MDLIVVIRFTVVRPKICSCGADKKSFSLALTGFVAKTLVRNDGEGGLRMKAQIPNINVVRSAWRRIKRDIKDAVIRDLKPVKDIKGGGGIAGKRRGFDRKENGT